MYERWYYEKKYKIANKRKFISFLLLVFTMAMFIVLLFVKDNKVYSSTYEGEEIM